MRLPANLRLVRPHPPPLAVEADANGDALARVVRVGLEVAPRPDLREGRARVPVHLELEAEHVVVRLDDGIGAAPRARDLGAVVRADHAEQHVHGDVVGALAVLVPQVVRDARERGVDDGDDARDVAGFQGVEQGVRQVGVCTGIGRDSRQQLPLEGQLHLVVRVVEPVAASSRVAVRNREVAGLVEDSYQVQVTDAEAREPPGVKRLSGKVYLTACGHEV